MMGSPSALPSLADTKPCAWSRGAGTVQPCVDGGQLIMIRFNFVRSKFN